MECFSCILYAMAFGVFFLFDWFLPTARESRLPFYLTYGKYLMMQ